MSESNIQTLCPRCLGTGVESSDEGTIVVCTSCNGLKYYVKDKIDTTEITIELDWIKKKIKKILKKLEIEED